MICSKKNIILISITVFFFAVIIILTLTARDIHIARIPHVTVMHPTREHISSNNRVLAIPMDVYTVNSDDGNISGDLLSSQREIFIIGTRIVNDEERIVVIHTTIQVDAGNGEYYEVINGLFGHELVVISSDKPLINGAEVFIVEQ